MTLAFGVCYQLALISSASLERHAYLEQCVEGYDTKGSVDVFDRRSKRSDNQTRENRQYCESCQVVLLRILGRQVPHQLPYDMPKIHAQTSV